MVDQKRLRFLLRKGEDQFITKRIASNILQLKGKELSNTLQELERLGNIQQSAIEGYWEPGMRGKLVAHQKFKQLYKIESLKKLFNAFLERVREIEESGKYPYQINKIKVTSEFPIVNRSHGIHISYFLKRKNITNKEYYRLSKELREQSGKIFNSTIDYYSYPSMAIEKFLKSGSHILKLREVNEEEIDVADGHFIDIL